MSRFAFTLIELMVVIVIIAILAGALMVGAQLLADKPPRTRTEATFGILQAALAKKGVEIGTKDISTIHPLASTTVDTDTGLERSNFVRESDGSAVARTGMAYVAEDASWLGGAASARLLDDDRFMGVVSSTAAACDLPGFYGMERQRMGVIGTAAHGLSEYRRVVAGAGKEGGIDDPRIHLWIKSDFADLSDQEAYEEKSRRAYEFLFGAFDDELRKLKAVIETIDTPDTPLAPCKRLRIDKTESGSGWRPGRYRVDVGDGEQWYRYRLRGHAVVDGWGNEIVCFQHQRGITFASAGKDGLFVMSPGDDQIYQTPPHEAIDSDNSDDEDATVDNLVEGHW